MLVLFFIEYFSFHFVFVSFYWKSLEVLAFFYSIWLYILLKFCRAKTILTNSRYNSIYYYGSFNSGYFMLFLIYLSSSYVFFINF